ncbi:hypothetical protein VNO80_20399 [Phaseolus coccineus]|uniref:Uncharacterized protein n=1 Tax=Phaseolus coccineus TaxID=3886 RepID=A0AAN9MHT3_PHACN
MSLAAAWSKAGNILAFDKHCFLQNYAASFKSLKLHNYAVYQLKKALQLGKNEKVLGWHASSHPLLVRDYSFCIRPALPKGHKHLGSGLCSFVCMIIKNASSSSTPPHQPLCLTG